MNDIEMKVSEILRDSNRLKRLLMLEKERRGVPEDALVFVGMANVASHWWCTQQAVFKSRAFEGAVFSAYLLDRIQYAHRLGLITELPESDDALLDIGKEITLANIQKLFKEKEQKAEERAKRSAVAHVTWVSKGKLNSAGNRIRLINPNLPPEEKQFEEEMAAEEGIRVIDLEEDPKWRGEFYQESRAEQYPTIRWNFPCGKYVVVGEPDGMKDQFVYEYKTTRNRYLFNFMKPVAFAQADLYGYFFRRPKKRVQICLVEENVTETYEEAVDIARAEGTLAAFARVDAGEPARPPRAWKCRKCDFRTTCPISQAT
jgi:hypothetical protein